MIDLFNQLPEFGWQLIILLLVIVIKSIISSVNPSKEIHFFQFYCRKLSDKVNNPKNGSQQQKIAGFIATIITIVPILIIVWLFEGFVEVPLLWQLVLLYPSLTGFGCQQLVKKMEIKLKENNKSHAKEIIHPKFLRDINNMSPLGLHKASIEMLWLTHLQQQFVVAIVFLLFGGFGAISYRLLLDMHYSWNTKQPSTTYFGAFVRWLISLFQWLPSRILALELYIISIGKSKQPYASEKSTFMSFSNNFLLSCIAARLGVQLGGVAMYQGRKLRRKSFNNTAKQPEASDAMLTIRQLNLVHTLNIGIILSILLIIITLSMVN